MKKVFILTEGGTTCGLGHLIRSYSLYQAFLRMNIHPFVILNAENKISPILDSIEYKLMNWAIDVSETLDVIDGADLVVVDSYLASKETLDLIAKSAKIAAFIDDNNRLDYPKGIIVNGLLYADQLGYRKDLGHTYLLGSKYVLLREEFVNVDVIGINDDIKSMLISLGGSNQDINLKKIIPFLNEKYPNIKKYILVSQNSIFIGRDDYHNCIFMHGLRASEIVCLMKSVDLAITAGGQFLLELIALGVPCVVTSVAQNQERNINSIIDRECIRFVGKIDSIDVENEIADAVNYLVNKEIRERYQYNGQSLFNKRGSREVVKELVRGYGNC